MLLTLYIDQRRRNDFKSGWASPGKSRWSVVITKTKTKESNAKKWVGQAYTVKKSGWATGPHGSAATDIDSTLLVFNTSFKLALTPFWLSNDDIFQFCSEPNLPYHMTPSPTPIISFDMPMNKHTQKVYLLGANSGKTPPVCESLACLGSDQSHVPIGIFKSQYPPPHRPMIHDTLITALHIWFIIITL